MAAPTHVSKACKELLEIQAKLFMQSKQDAKALVRNYQLLATGLASALLAFFALQAK